MTEAEVTELIKCAREPLHFIFNYIKTWDGETNSVRTFAEGYPQTYKDKLGKLILAIIDVIKKGRKSFILPDFHIFKSRQTYVSHTILAGISVYCLLFIENSAGLVTSDKAEKLDNSNHSDFNTALGKISFAIDNLPSFLKPPLKTVIRNDKNINYIPMNSSVKGDCGIAPGMGLQLSYVFNDEHAGQEFSFTKQSTIIEACKGAQICASTPKGKNNVFYNIWEFGKSNPDKTSFQFWEFDWKEKMLPVEHDKYYEEAVRRYKGDMAMLSQELDRSWSGISAKGRVFTSFISSKHIVNIKPLDIKLGITCCGWDFGVGAPTVFIIATVIKDEIFIIDTYHESGTSPHRVAIEFKKKCQEWGVPYHLVKNIGDPSGSSKPRESADYDSSFELFRHEGIYIEKGNNRIMEGIQTINGQFYLDKLKINKRCNILIDALNEAVYPSNDSGDVTKEAYVCEHPLIDHLDAFKYIVRYMSSMLQPSKSLPDKKFVSLELGSSKPNNLFD